MAAMDYLNNLSHGILNVQYAYLFILSFNPYIFKLFEVRHFVILLPAILLSFFSHRAVLPFLLLIILDLDYSNFTKDLKKKMLYMFFIATFVVALFGGGYVG